MNQDWDDVRCHHSFLTGDCLADESSTQRNELSVLRNPTMTSINDFDQPNLTTSSDGMHAYGVVCKPCPLSPVFNASDSLSHSLACSLNLTAPPRKEGLWHSHPYVAQCGTTPKATADLYPVLSEVTACSDPLSKEIYGRGCLGSLASSHHFSSDLADTARPGHKPDIIR